MLEASIEDIEYRQRLVLTVVGTDKRIGLFEIAKAEKTAPQLSRRLATGEV